MQSFHFSSGQRAVVARARLEEARALLRSGDPSCRELLEDVGTVFEELGDTSAVLEIDALLRRAAIDIEETPRSFHFRVAPPHRIAS